MERKTIIFILLIMLFTKVQSQEVINGSELENPKNRMVTKMLEGDGTCFFAYRYKSSKSEFYFVIEKYEKDSLKPVYSTEMESKDNLESILSVGNHLYLFFQEYNEAEKKLSLYFREMSPEGKLMPEKGDIMSVISGSREFVNLEIIQNPDKSKFVFKVSYRDVKSGSIQTDFAVINSKTFEILNRKTIDESFFMLSSESSNSKGGISFNHIRYMEIATDKNNTIFWGYGFVKKNLDKDEDLMNNLTMVIMPAKEREAKRVELVLEPTNKIYNVKFVINSNNQLLVAGFLRNIVQASGPDYVTNGIFGYTISLETYKITANAIQLFEENALTPKGFEPDDAKHINYKVDYMFEENNSAFLLGQQYYIKRNIEGGSTVTMVTYNHDYYDITAVKYNPEGKFEWVKKLPFRFSTDDKGPSYFDDYVAFINNKKIYVLNNENIFSLKNTMKTNDSKNMAYYTDVRWTNFVYSSLTTDDGNYEHKLIFTNKPYCFVPSVNPDIHTTIIKPYIRSLSKKMKLQFEWEELFLQNNNEVIIFTNQKGKDRFSKFKVD